MERSADSAHTPGRVLVVDDHPIVRTGIAALLMPEPDLRVVAEAADGVDAVARHRSHRPDVTLMDVRMPRMDGIEAMRAIRAEQPGARILALSSCEGDADIHAALDAGACGYLIKSTPGDEIVRAVRAAANGRRVVPPDVAARLAEFVPRVDLTAREVEVQRFFGAHTYRRTAFAGDYTGLEIQRTLVARTAQLRVPVLDTVYVSRLLVRDGVVFGAYGFDLIDGTRYVIHADAVVLATGGHTRIWRHTSSRRDENTGDSFRLAVDAGARLRDPELVQFHPSGLLEPEDAAGTLVSEAARGEGGILRNALGERFMARYDPERMELSTRDRVALASDTEIRAGRGTPRGGVLLDVSHLPRETIMRRLPRVYHTLLDLQLLDVTTAPIEVAPTAHYSMGGVWVRPDDHGTDVEGLYAVGEASSGLHGANRLGGNSLIELLVYGRIVGEAAAAYSAGLTAQPRSARAVAEARAEVDALLAADGPENVRVLQRAIRDVMTERAGVVRDETGLRAGLHELATIDARIPQIGVHPDLAGFQDLAHALDLKAAALAARATLDAALERRETRGCHNRADYPALDAAYRYGHAQIRHTYQLRSAGGAIPLFPDLLGFRPVAAEHRIEWSRLFDAAGAPPAARAKRMDGRLAGSLIALPVALTGATDVEALHSLAVRDLTRGEGVGLPSGEAVARRMGERPLSVEEVGTSHSGWSTETPLWYYILREADVREGGDRLGPVGGRLVREVLVGLLDLDAGSVRHAPTSWTPSLTLIELLSGEAT